LLQEGFGPDALIAQCYNRQNYIFFHILFF
jgi:hypothetical protein